MVAVPESVDLRSVSCTDRNSVSIHVCAFSVLPVEMEEKFKRQINGKPSPACSQARRTLPILQGIFRVADELFTRQTADRARRYQGRLLNTRPPAEKGVNNSGAGAREFVPTGVNKLREARALMKPERQYETPISWHV